MEDGLWLKQLTVWLSICCCLNPCLNGRWSLTARYVGGMAMLCRLNPCLNGRWSLTNGKSIIYPKRWVLILIWVEDGLWPFSFRPVVRKGLTSLNPYLNGRWSLTSDGQMIVTAKEVLILVWMEECLWIVGILARDFRNSCLNPCLSGRWSLTKQKWLRQ